MMLEKAAPPPEIASDYRIRALIVGPSKTGKTTSALTAPGKKLLIDTDLRAQAAVGFPNVDILPILRDPGNLKAGWRDLEKLLGELWSEVRKKTLEYDTIIFDGLSSMKRLAMDHCLTLTGSDNKALSTSPGGGPSQAHYGPQIHMTDKFINQALPLPCHVIFTGHFYAFEDQKINKLEWFPNVFGAGLRNEIGSWFDETYATGRRQGKYIWQTFPDSRLNFIGSTLNKLGRYWKDPIEIDFNQPLVGFQKLLGARFQKEAKNGPKD